MMPGTLTPLRSDNLPPNLHSCFGVARTAFQDFKAQLAVIEQQIGAGNQGRENLRMRQRHALPVSSYGLQIEPEPVSGAQFNGAVRKSPDTQFGTLQIHHDSDRTAYIPFNIPDRLKALLVILVVSMTEIQPEHIDAGVEQ
jgi:hypothetical protein